MKSYYFFLDQNECTNGVASCNHHCQNTPGDYYCYCKTGYKLDIDNETCIGKVGFSKKKHIYKVLISKKHHGFFFLDTIECNNNNGGCAQHCTNTNGSYYCTCDSGYDLGSDGHACIDSDECALDTHLCDHHCYNNIGSYTCGCKIGYVLESDGLNCSGMKKEKV